MNLGTPVATKVVGSLVLLLLAAVGWLAVLGPETRALATLHEQTETAQAQNEVFTQQVLTLQEQAEHLGATRATARALSRKFPPTADQPGLFGQVTGAAIRAGLGPDDITALSPAPPTIGAVDPEAGVQPATDGTKDLARQAVTVSVEGDFAATQRLLANLEGLPRAYLVSTVSLTAGSRRGSYTTAITGDMFVMPPAKPPGQALDLASAEAP